METQKEEQTGQSASLKSNVVWSEQPTSIFIRSYRADFELLEMCLLGIYRYSTGFSEVVLAVPSDDYLVASARFQCLPSRLHSDLPLRIVEWTPLHANGYIDQQLTKISADFYLDLRSKVVLFLDSDMIPVSSFSKESVLSDRRWFRRRSETLDENDVSGVPWRKGFLKLFGEDLKYDYMRRAPFWVPTGLLEMARLYVLNRTNKIFQEFGAALEPNPRVFSEFTLLARVALLNNSWCGYEFCEETPFQTHVPEHKWLRICWSWGTKTREQATLECDLFKLGVDLLPEIKVATVVDDTHFRKWVEAERRLDYDSDTFGKVMPYVRADATVVEAGANIGTHTVRYAQKAKAVVAFEPHPSAYAALTYNVGKYPTLRAFNFALSNRWEKRWFKRLPNCGASHIVINPDMPASDWIQCMPLDALELQDVSLIHLDAEGWEFAILSGAFKTIQRCRPAIWIELNQITLARQGLVPDSILGLLTSMGYNCSGIDTSIVQQDVLLLPCE